jgi:glycosyltransferase involved in cell wall biosynthesis
MISVAPTAPRHPLLPITEATPVSVLLPAHNAARFVEQAVRSTLAQTHRHLELIAIDDGSTDGTGDILRRLAREDDRVRVLSHENMGMGRSLNDAIAKARYDWLARMDADDVMPPDRIARQLAFLAANPHLVVCSSLVHYIDSAGKVIGHNRSDFTDPENVKRMLRENRPVGFHHPAVMMRKDVILDVGGYRHQFWPCDDLDLWNRVLERHPDGVLVQDAFLMQYRIHQESICVSAARKVCQTEDWVRECMISRRAGKAEPTWEAYRQSLDALPLLERLGRSRRAAARTQYKLATLHYSKRRYLRLVPALLLASLLEPSYVVRRVLPQFRRVD